MAGHRLPLTHSVDFLKSLLPKEATVKYRFEIASEAPAEAESVVVFSLEAGFTTLGKTYISVCAKRREGSKNELLRFHPGYPAHRTAGVCDGLGLPVDSEGRVVLEP